jgi:hypothetical protein
MNLVSKTLAAEPWTGLAEGDVATFKSLETIVSNILGIASALAGIAVFVMLILGGFKLLTAGGNPEQVKKATGTITWAVVGLIILLAIWFIFMFIEEFTGVEISVFKLDSF